MEIISLKTKGDDIEFVNAGSKQNDGARLVITELKQGVKNPNRVNVFVNSKYEFSLDITQVVDFKIKVGMEISPEQLLEYKKASEFGKLYQRALEKALTRPHSEREMRDYLVRKLRKPSSDTLGPARRYGRTDANSLPVGRAMSSEDIAELSGAIISRLVSRGHLNDFEFAKWYVGNRFVKKGVSRKRLKMELMKKGVSAEIIDEVIDGRDDAEEILKIIAKKRAKYDDERLIQYLCRQGFSYQLVQSLVRTYEKD